jgi:protein TonB
MKNLLFLSTFLFSMSAFAQSDTDRPVRVCDEMPTLEQCEDLEDVSADRCTQMAIMQFVSDNITYPEIAQDAGVEGTIYVSFIVEKDGSVGETRLMRGLGEGEAAEALSAEALRVVALLPEFTPGKQEGEIVRVNFVAPVKYKLSK